MEQGGTLYSRKVLIVAKCIVNNGQVEIIDSSSGSINSSKVYCKLNKGF